MRRRLLIAGVASLLSTVASAEVTSLQIDKYDAATAKMPCVWTSRSMQGKDANVAIFSSRQQAAMQKLLVKYSADQVRLHQKDKFNPYVDAMADARALGKPGYYLTGQRMGDYLVFSIQSPFCIANPKTVKNFKKCTSFIMAMNGTPDIADFVGIMNSAQLCQSGKDTILVSSADSEEAGIVNVGSYTATVRDGFSPTSLPDFDALAELEPDNESDAADRDAGGGEPAKKPQ